MESELETSKDRYDRTMEEVRNTKMDGLPTDAEVDEVIAGVTSFFA